MISAAVYFSLTFFPGFFVFSHWVTRVLLPSGHTPHGDGVTWDIFPAKKDVVPV